MGKCRPGPRRGTPGRERQVRNMLREGLDGARIPAGCAVSSIFSKSGQRRSGEDIIRSIALMHDRSNGLGGGFAAYGPILQGLNAPINDLSRGCDAEEVYQMSIITAALA